MASIETGTKRTLVVIGGPTASGKTRVAAALAKHFATEVISADSRQFYAGMRIGTARPAKEELLGVKHHFLGHLKLEETWSAGAFARAAEPVLQELLDRNGIAIMVGGSGLYLDAVIKGLDQLPASDIRLRATLMERMKDQGLPALLGELHKLDPIAWGRIDKHNPHRVIRALEICLLSGRSGSSQQTFRSDRSDLHIVRIAMDLPRLELYDRIDLRVDAMIRSGLVEEARALLPYREMNSLRTVGYREMFSHFDGEHSLFEAIRSIKQHTRNYAKRQLTWLRRDRSWQSIAPDRIETMIGLVQAGIKA